MNNNRLFVNSVYKDNLKRIKMPGVVMLALCLIIILVPLIISDGYYTQMVTELLTGVFSTYSYFGVMVLVFSAFSFLFRRNASDFFHALPLTRRSLYINVVLSILTWVFATIAICAAAGSITALLIGLTLDIPLIFITIISSFLIAMLVCGCLVLGVSITGTAFTSLAVAGLIMFLPRVVLAICAATMQSGSPMLIMNWEDILSGGGLSMPIALLTGSSVYNDISFWQSALYSLALAAAYLAVGGLVFCRRASETAERPAPGRLVQHICRLLLALPFLMIAFALIIDGNSSNSDGVTSLFVVAVVVYALYELITTKRFKNLKNAFLLFPIAIVAAFLLCFGAKVYGSTLMSRLPAASEIKSVQEISGGGSYESTELAKVWLEDESLKALTADCLENSYRNIDGRNDIYKYSRIDVNIKLNSGRTISRSLYLTYAQHEELYNAIHSNGKYEDALIAWPSDDDIKSMRLYTSSYYAYENSNNNLRLIWQELTKEYGGMSREEKLEFKANGRFAQSAVGYEYSTTELAPMPSHVLPISVEVTTGNGVWSAYNLSLNTPNTSLAVMNMINEENAANISRIAELHNSGDIENNNYSLFILDNQAEGGAFGGQYSIGYQKDYEDGGAMPELAISEADNAKLFWLLYANSKKPLTLNGITIMFEIYTNKGELYERVQSCFANVSADELEWILSLNIQSEYR